MVTLNYETIRIDNREFISVRLPENINVLSSARIHRKNTLLFALAEHQSLRGTLQFNTWFIDDRRESYACTELQGTLGQDLLEMYIADIRGELSYPNNGMFPDEVSNILHYAISASTDFMYNENPTLFGQGLLSVILDIYGPGIKEYDWDNISDSDSRLNIHRIKTATGTYIRLNKLYNPLRIYAIKNADMPAFAVNGIDALNDMFLDISESPEELFKIGAYAFPPLLRESKILREWRIGRELEVVDDFRKLPY